MLLQLFQTVGYLSLLAAGGFLVFRHPWMQRRAFPVFLFLILQVMFPIYFIVRIPTGWESAGSLGWQLLAALFLLCLAMMALQGWLGRVVAARPWAGVTQPTSYILLAALHNAGFIPLPILERLAPEGVLLGMFFYLFAFNLTFWSFAVPIIRTGHIQLRRLAVRPNAPIVGMAIGFLVALTGVHHVVPPRIFGAGLLIGDLALDGALVALGGALAGIREPIRFTREHWIFAGWRMILYPAVVSVVLLLPLPGLDGPLGWGLRLMIVLQAVTPPATQTMVVTRALGTPEQLHYTGEMILFSYMVSLVTIPVFMTLALLLY